MSLSTNRLMTLKALIAGSVACSVTPAFATISQELDALHDARNVRPRLRRSLLEIVHASRALESCLRVINQHYGCSQSARALGQYLVALRDHAHATLGKLREHHRSRFQQSIVRRRNRYLHEAGSYPTTQEVDHLLAETQDCLVTVLGLE